MKASWYILDDDEDIGQLVEIMSYRYAVRHA